VSHIPPPPPVDKQAIGFVVYRADARGTIPRREIGKEAVVTSSAYAEAREVSLWCEFLPGHTYYIVASTYEPGLCGEFFISIRAESPITVGPAYTPPRLYPSNLDHHVPPP